MTASSKINKFFDSLKFDKYRTLRKKILNIKNKNLFNAYDYGNGYFYQSFERIGLSGLRNTEMRVNSLGLNNLLKGKSILDIGTNTGFLLMQTNLSFLNCVAIDWDLSSILVAKECQRNLEIKNIIFFQKNFFDFHTEKKFDVVMSLANHTTYDGGIKNYIEYFEHTKKFLNKNGIMIFESHHPEIENDNDLKIILEFLKKSFEITYSGIYKFNNYADDKRKFFILKSID